MHKGRKIRKVVCITAWNEFLNKRDQTPGQRPITLLRVASFLRLKGQQGSVSSKANL